MYRIFITADVAKEAKEILEKEFIVKELVHQKSPTRRLPYTTANSDFPESYNFRICPISDFLPITFMIFIDNLAQS